MNGEKKKHSRMWIIVLAMFLIAAFVGPVIINCLYKQGPGWITMWEAPDMLAYYGTILGAAVTAFSLILTISFTRKQIGRDRFLERDLGRWNKIESIFSQALIDISPLKMQRTEIIGKNPTQDFQTIILNLNMYATKALTSLDNLKCYVSPEEYEKIEIYVNDIRKAITQFCDIEEELVSYYKQLLDIAAVNGETADNREFSCYLKLVDECFKKVPTGYMGPYQDLLNMKREVFDGIYADIEDEARQILLFSRRKKVAS